MKSFAQYILSCVHDIPSSVKKQLNELKHLTKFIDFKCDWIDGKCRDCRQGNKPCCYQCAEMNGFFNCIQFDAIDAEQAQYYIARWDETLGFRSRQGVCSLPHDLRAASCVFYNCDVKEASIVAREYDKICRANRLKVPRKSRRALIVFLIIEIACITFLL